MSYAGPVLKTRELERVLALPRREPDFKAQKWVDLAWQWSPMLLNEAGKREWDRIVALPDLERDREFARFARPRDKFELDEHKRLVLGPDGKPIPGVGCPLLLLPEQAAMLYEAFHVGGLFASAGVGTGKTLVTLLLALILGSAVPLLLIPGGLDGKTKEEFADLARYWKVPRPLPQIVSFEKLQGPNSATLLCDCKRCAGTKEEPPVPGGIRPTHIFVDESDGFQNPQSARTRRLTRYMSRHPTTFYAGLTGSAWSKSIKDSAPQLVWALKFGAPVPLVWTDMLHWSEAIDFSSRGEVRDPGALCWLAGVDPVSVATYEERLEIAAEGFKNRLLWTPGVIQTEGQSCDQPLTIRLLKAPDDPLLDQAFHHFRKTKTTLDGWDVADPLTKLKHAAEMSAGFFYVWDPRPPKAWMDARKAAAKFVQEKIAASARAGRPLDSQAPVYRAYPDEPVLRAWLEIEPTFTPNTVARPITASVFGYACAWLKLNGPALVWVQHDYAGQTLSAMSGIPFFSSKGKDSSGRYIGKYSPELSAILSLDANMKGRNLQAWNRNLVIAPPSSQKKWQQAICGRTHRKGQDRPVFIDVIVACSENIRALEKARGSAAWQEATVGSPHRLLIAEYDWTHFPAAELEALPEEHPSRARWNG